MNRYSAFATHLAISLVIFGFLAYLVVYVWYPDFLFGTDGGWQGIRIIILNKRNRRLWNRNGVQSPVRLNDGARSMKGTNPCLMDGEKGLVTQLNSEHLTG